MLITVNRNPTRPGLRILLDGVDLTNRLTQIDLDAKLARGLIKSPDGERVMLVNGHGLSPMTFTRRYWTLEIRHAGNGCVLDPASIADTFREDQVWKKGPIHVLVSPNQ